MILQARSRLAPVAGCLLTLANCAAVQPVAVSPRDTALAFRARSLDDAGLRTAATRPETGFAEWPPGRLDARALAVTALYFNPDLQVARDKWRAANAAIVTAGQLPNPTLSVSPLYVSTAIAGVPPGVAGMSPWVVASSLVQIIETAGKRQFRLARSRYLAEAARLDALSIAWDTTSKVNSALTDVAAGKARATAIGRQVAVQSELVEVTGKLMQGGFGSSLELLTARTVLNRAILDQQAVQTTLTDAQHQLAQTVGLPFDAIPKGRLSLPSLDQRLPPGFAAQVRQAAPLNRADLLARLADYAASVITLQLEVANSIPNVELGPNFEYDQGDLKWGLNLTFQLPIFNQNEGPIAEAVAQRRQAAGQFIAAQASVIGEVERAIAAYDSALRSLAAADRLFQQQNQQARTQETLFARGEADRSQLLAARVELATAALARVDSQAAVARAGLAVEQAGHLAAGGFDPATFAVPERR